MVRLGLIGDTQGRYSVDRLLAFVAGQFQDVDEIWHVGDWQEERVLEGLRALGKPLEVVNGNAPDDPRFPMMVRRQLEGLELAMVHRPPKPGDAWVEDCDIVIHGHTHRWRDEVAGRTRFINVATPTAAGFSQERTLGILTLQAGAAELNRIVVELP
ncbi:MAG: metallophosphatase family protein [Candidatus Dormibacteraeota bacterium]|nr:metallophosphatase family protein [Candidatus Dormibacteraeota bacterium]